jgi:anthranilate/para-aminobenzoate synthase component II
MGITNANATVHGVQGHPESIGSLEGDAVLRAFLDAAHA